MIENFISMQEEIIDIVDRKDKIIGKATRKQAKEKGLIYRCAGVYVRSNGKILIQKRSKTKSTRPNNWSILEETVKTGETYEEAAKRGLKEELGLKTKKLYYLGKKFIDDKEYNDKFFMKIYECKGKGKIKIQKEEIEEVETLNIDEIKKLVKTEEKISPSLLKTFKTLLKYSRKEV